MAKLNNLAIPGGGGGGGGRVRTPCPPSGSAHGVIKKCSKKKILMVADFSIFQIIP